MQGAEAIGRPVDDGPERLGIADVGNEGFRPSSEGGDLSHALAGGLGVNVDDAHRGASTREDVTDRAADALAAARDDGHAAFESESNTIPADGDGMRLRCTVHGDHLVLCCRGCPSPPGLGRSPHPAIRIRIVTEFDNVNLSGSHVESGCRRAGLGLKCVGE